MSLLKLPLAWFVMSYELANFFFSSCHGKQSSQHTFCFAFQSGSFDSFPMSVWNGEHEWLACSLLHWNCIASVTCSLAAYQRPKWADQCCHCKIRHCSVRCQYVTSHWKDISLSCQFFNVKIPIGYLWDHFLIEYSIFSITSPATSPPIELAIFLCHWVIMKFMPW